MKEKLDEALFTELVKLYSEADGQNLPDAKPYHTGKDVFVQGSMPKGIYYIKQGAVKLTRNMYETPVTVRLAGNHEFVGYLSLLKHTEYDSTATVVEPSKIYFIPGHLFFMALDSNITFVTMLLDMVCTRVTEKNELLNGVLTKSTQQRLALLLLSLARNNSNGHVTIMKKDIASILNIKAETLSRNLLRMQQKGAIKLPGKTNPIEILNADGLIKLFEITD